jgi:hypothetical protein
MLTPHCGVPHFPRLTTRWRRMADDREVYAAFAALSSTSRAFLATVEQAIGSGVTAKISKRDFAVRGISRGNSWSDAKTRLVRLGFIEVEAGGPNGCAKTANTYSLTDRFREIGEVEAQHLVRVERRRAPRTVRLLRMLARAAGNGNAEARRLLDRHTREPDAFELANLSRLRPDLFEKADPRGKPKRPRRHFGDDHLGRRLREGARSRPAR